MSYEVLCQRQLHGRLVSAVLADLTRMPVDAIVNAANTHLAHGGGLAGAIVRAGGPIIQEESSRLAPVPAGSAVATSGGTLPCRWVIHAVGPRWGEGEEENKLRSAVKSALDVGAGLEIRTFAIPAISTGIFGYPKNQGTLHIVESAKEWLDSHRESTISEILFAAFDEETAQLFDVAVRSLDCE